MCLISSESTTHVSHPTAPSPSARYPHAADNARCAMDAHHSGTPNPRNGFACQPRCCILNPAFRATSASYQRATRPASLLLAILSAQHATMHHHVPCRVSSSISQRDPAAVVPACFHVLKQLDKQLTSFEVRRHDAASCAIRHEHAGCRWLKTPPFGVCSD